MKAKRQNVVSEERHKLEEVLPLDFPFSLAIDPCNLCNFECKFCAIQDSKEKLSFQKQFMDLELFKKIIDDISVFSKKLKVLRLSGQGEPLLNPHFAEMVSYAKEKQVAEYIETVTNGSKLNPQLNRELVESGIDRIRISIEEVTEEGYFAMANRKINFKEFIANIKDLHEKSGSSCEIYIKTVDAAVDTEEKREKFFSTFGDICDKISIEHVIPIWTGYDEIYQDFDIETAEGLHGHAVKELDVCPFPFYSFVINPDGEVTVCCNDWERKISMGNVTSESVYDIWNGEKYHNFLLGMLEKGRKENHPVGCAKCQYPCFDAVDDLDSHREIVLGRFKHR